MMIRKKILYIVGLILMSNLAFLPGPDFLYEFSNLLFIIGQVVALIGIVTVLPIGTVLVVTNSSTQNKWYTLGVFLIIGQITVLISSIFVSRYFRDMSRNIAINNAQPIIVAIENFYSDKKIYPNTLQNITPNYLQNIPSDFIAGIKDYNYSKKENYFELSFTQNAILGFNWEVVIYNPIDKHESSGELVDLYPTNNEHWKYYIYD